LNDAQQEQQQLNLEHLKQKELLEKEINNLTEKQLISKNSSNLSSKQKELELLESKLILQQNQFFELEQKYHMKQLELDQKEKNLNEELFKIQQRYEILDNINQKIISTLTAEVERARNEKTRKHNLAEQATKNYQDAENRLKEMEDRIKITSKINRPRIIEVYWVELCRTLNSRLALQTKPLQLNLTPIIDIILWKDWKGSNEIFNCLYYLKNSIGNSQGLKFFREVLIQLNEQVSVEIIDSSHCKNLFQ